MIHLLVELCLKPDTFLNGWGSGICVFTDSGTSVVFPPVLGIMNAHVCAKIIFLGVSEVMYAEYL